MSPSMDEQLAKLREEAASSASNIAPMLDGIRELTEPWLGEPGTRPAADIVRELVAKRNAEDADKRRLGIARLSELDILTFLDLPDGFEAVGVHADWSRMSIEVMVRSKTLDPVISGAIPPDLEGAWDREVYVEEYTAVDENDDLRRARRPWYRMGWSPIEAEEPS